MGFDAIEVGVEVLEKTGGSEPRVKAFGRRLREAGMPVGCVRAGGTLTDARHGPHNRQRQAQRDPVRRVGGRGGRQRGAERSCASARAPGGQPSGIPARLARGPGRVSRRHALRVRGAGEGMSGRLRPGRERRRRHLGEVHQNSLVDNSWSAQLIHGLVSRRNFGINPDLGNLLWTYDVPEESPEDCIRRAGADLRVLALQEPVPSLSSGDAALRVPAGAAAGRRDRLPLRPVCDARGGLHGLHGPIEGAAAGDQFHADQKSLAYAKDGVGRSSCAPAGDAERRQA